MILAWFLLIRERQLFEREREKKYIYNKKHHNFDLKILINFMDFGDTTLAVNNQKRVV